MIKEINAYIKSKKELAKFVKKEIKNVTLINTIAASKKINGEINEASKKLLLAEFYLNNYTDSPDKKMISNVVKAMVNLQYRIKNVTARYGNDYDIIDSLTDINHLSCVRYHNRGHIPVPILVKALFENGTDLESVVIRNIVPTHHIAIYYVIATFFKLNQHNAKWSMDEHNLYQFKILNVDEINAANELIKKYGSEISGFYLCQLSEKTIEYVIFRNGERIYRLTNIGETPTI